MGICCHQAKKNKAHVTDTRIADHKFEVVLHQGNRGPIKNSHNCQKCENLPPGFEPEEMRLPGVHAVRKQTHSHSETTISSQFHDDSGQQHGGSSRCGDVTCGRPRVKG